MLADSRISRRAPRLTPPAPHEFATFFGMKRIITVALSLGLVFAALSCAYDADSDSAGMSRTAAIAAAETLSAPVAEP